MEKIPFFMTKPPDEVNPEEDIAIAAMQSLKYEEENPQGARGLAASFTNVPEKLTYRVV